LNIVDKDFDSKVKSNYIDSEKGSVAFLNPNKALYTHENACYEIENYESYNEKEETSKECKNQDYTNIPEIKLIKNKIFNKETKIKESIFCQNGVIEDNYFNINQEYLETESPFSEKKALKDEKIIDIKEINFQNNINSKVNEKKFIKNSIIDYLKENRNIIKEHLEDDKNIKIHNFDIYEIETVNVNHKDNRSNNLREKKFGFDIKTKNITPINKKIPSFRKKSSIRSKKVSKIHQISRSNLKKDLIKKIIHNPIST